MPWWCALLMDLAAWFHRRLLVQPVWYSAGFNPASITPPWLHDRQDRKLREWLERWRGWRPERYV